MLKAGFTKFCFGLHSTQTYIGPNLVIISGPCPTLKAHSLYVQFFKL